MFSTALRGSWMKIRAMASVVVICTAPLVAQAADPASQGVHVAQTTPELNSWWVGYETVPTVALPDGRHMLLYCTGSGVPTVVFESGLGDGAWSWRKVQTAIAEKTRACSYDRAGYGRSDAAEGSRDIDAEQSDLEVLLKAAHLQGPFVLVGHSLGGEILRQYAYRHFENVAGLVMVDTATEHQNARYEAVKPGFLKLQAAAFDGIRLCANKLKKGPLVPGTPEAISCTPMTYADMPPEAVKLHQAHARNPARLWVQLSEFDAMNDGADDREADAARRPLGDLPLVVLTGANTTNVPIFTPAEQQEAATAWKALHDEVARLSTQGINRLVPDSSHYIQDDQPRTVIDAVLGVVSQVRAER